MVKPIERQNIQSNKITSGLYQHLNELLVAIDKIELTDETVDLINEQIISLNSISDSKKHFQQSLKVTGRNIIRLLEKRHRIVPINHYRKLWMILGMTSFAIPICITFGLSMKNFTLTAIGFPIGMVVGIAIGKKLDDKAFREGRQLNIVSIF